MFNKAVWQGSGERCLKGLVAAFLLQRYVLSAQRGPIDKVMVRRGRNRAHVAWPDVVVWALARVKCLHFEDNRLSENIVASRERRLGIGRRGEGKVVGKFRVSIFVSVVTTVLVTCLAERRVDEVPMWSKRLYLKPILARTDPLSPLCL